MSMLQFYNDQAAQCRAQADLTGLANVRDRCLNAAAAWASMADRVRRTETFRVLDAARKADQSATGAVRE